MINPTSINNNSSALYLIQPVSSVNYQSSSKETQKIQFIPKEKGTDFDQYWQDLKNVDFIDSKGIPPEEISKLYPLGCLDGDEVKTWFNLVTRPIQAKLEIEFSIVEFCAFLYNIAPAAGIKIHSTNICGGAIPELFWTYYIRTLNDCYAKHRHEKNSSPQKL
jgi:hypothetical protein